jgi:hypothetical protein
MAYNVSSSKNFAGCSQISQIEAILRSPIKGSSKTMPQKQWSYFEDNKLRER